MSTYGNLVFVNSLFTKIRLAKNLNEYKKKDIINFVILNLPTYEVEFPGCIGSHLMMCNFVVFSLQSFFNLFSVTCILAKYSKTRI